MSDICFWSATRLAKAIKAKEISATEAVEACLARIETTGPTLNAVVQLARERALREAKIADAMAVKGESMGPLHGVPITIKDSLDTAEIISTGGTLGRAQFIPERDAAVVARLRQAGAILLGKTNTPELTMSGETENLIYGRTCNPYDPAFSCGGSSGGSAANVAVGGAALDVGSDTGGSVRAPASFCGIAGLKPSTGRIPRSGHIVPYGMGAVDSLTHLGPLARFVDDLALSLPLMIGMDWEDPSIVPMPLGEPADVDLSSLRIAYYTEDGLTPLDAEIAATVKATAAALYEDGLEVEEARPDFFEAAATTAGRIRQADGGAMSRRLLARAGTGEPGPYITDCFYGPPGLDGESYSEALEQADRARSGMLGFLRHFDAIVCPVTRNTAPAHGTTGHETFLMWSYTMVYNLTGWPAATVRAGQTQSGLPIGVQLVAAPWRDDVALALAGRVEKLMGGFRPPPIRASG